MINGEIYRMIDELVIMTSAIALGYGLDDRGFESRQGLGMFLFTAVSRPALGYTRGSYTMDVRSSFPWGKAAEA
jgi:hypothetical protein